MKKKTKVFLFFCLIALLALGQKCFGQCSSDMSIYMPPREDASKVEKIDSIFKSEAVFYFTRKDKVLYVFSGLIGKRLSNCEFLASAPLDQFEVVKKKLLEQKGEERFFLFFGTTFHCEEKWKQYFDTP